MLYIKGSEIEIKIIMKTRNLKKSVGVKHQSLSMCVFYREWCLRLFVAYIVHTITIYVPQKKRKSYGLGTTQFDELFVSHPLGGTNVLCSKDNCTTEAVED